MQTRVDDLPLPAAQAASLKAEPKTEFGIIGAISFAHLLNDMLDAACALPRIGARPTTPTHPALPSPAASARAGYRLSAPRIGAQPGVSVRAVNDVAAAYTLAPVSSSASLS